VPVDTLSLDPANARQHNPRNLEAIRRSYERFGQQKPIVVDAEGQVIASGATASAVVDANTAETLAGQRIFDWPAVRTLAAANRRRPCRRPGPSSSSPVAGPPPERGGPPDAARGGPAPEPAAQRPAAGTREPVGPGAGGHAQRPSAPAGGPRPQGLLFDPSGHA